MSATYTQSGKIKAALLCGGMLAGSLFGATAAFAQEQNGLEEIIVTARKRVERVQDVPASVTAFSPEQLERSDMSSIERIAASTPQLVIARASTGSGGQISLRGVGSNFTSIGIEQSVGVIIDGSYYGQGRVINEGFFDLGRLEILKGPQALFFGKNATAGVVSLTTADPTDKVEGYARVGYEFRSQSLAGEVVGSTPLTNNLGLRIALKGTGIFGGYFKNRPFPGSYVTTDTKTFATGTYPTTPVGRKQPGGHELLGRVTLKWTPTDRLSITLKGYGSNSHADAAGWNNVPLCLSETSFANPAVPCSREFLINQSNLPPAVAATGLRGAKDGQLYNDYTAYAVNGAINYNLDNIAITSITNYNYNRNGLLADYSYTGANNNWATEFSSFHAFSNETRLLTSFDGPINLLLGTYYQNTKRYMSQIPIFGGVENTAAATVNRFAATVKDSETKGETISGYGQAIWKVVPQVELTGGVRYIHETKDSYFIQTYTNPFLLGIFTPDVLVPGNQSFDNWSPEATLTWKPTDTLTLYGAFKTGYKSGGFSNASVYGPNTRFADLAFGPERARGFEAGVKGSLLDRQLRFDLGVYRYNYSGLQVDYFNAQTISYVTTNAGSARVQGVELAIQAAPRALPGLTLRGTANYNRSRYTQFIGPCYGGQSQAEGCVFPAPGSAPGALPQFHDLKGVPTANAPEWTASLGADYETDLGGMKFGLSTDARYSSSYFASGFGSPISRQGSYINLDASARLRTQDDTWEIAVIGKNLTNRFVITGAYDITFTGQPTGTPAAGRLGDQAGSIALPRNIQLQVTRRF